MRDILESLPSGAASSVKEKDRRTEADHLQFGTATHSYGKYFMIIMILFLIIINRFAM